jgi:hypothetical protein
VSLLNNRLAHFVVVENVADCGICTFLCALIKIDANVSSPLYFATQSSCSLIFGAQEKAMVAYLPAIDVCCTVCSFGEGCAPLRPDWLSSSPQRYYAGAYQLDGDWCYEYCTPGSEAASDCWAFRNDAVATPCAYREAFEFPAPGPGAITHNLTMIRGSFVTARPPPSTFALPAGREQQCAQPCPRIFGLTCG